MTGAKALPAIETCTSCRGTVAEHSVLWNCLPVPCFGNPERTRVRVASVGLNPSSLEFLDPGGNPKPESERLPVVADFGVQDRMNLTAAAVQKARLVRDHYFANKPHVWFTPMQMMLREMNPGWSYAEGTAIQIDVVACATNARYGELSSAVKSALEKSCRPYLARSLGKLANGTWLVVNGTGAFEALRKAVNVVINDTYSISLAGKPPIKIYVGEVQTDGRALPYFGWSIYLHQSPIRQAGAVVDYWKSLPSRF